VEIGLFWGIAGLDAGGHEQPWYRKEEDKTTHAALVCKRYAAGCALVSHRNFYAHKGAEWG
jgi:hypothetical protein